MTADHLNIYHMHIGPLRAVLENTTVSPLIAKNATQALGSRCSISLLMSRRVQFDIYVEPSDANESQYKSKNENACRSNLICGRKHRFFVQVI